MRRPNPLENPVIVAVLRTKADYAEHEADIKTAMTAAADQEAAARKLTLLGDETWVLVWCRHNASTNKWVSADEPNATHVRLELQRNVL